MQNFSVDMSFQSFQEFSQELISEIEHNINDYPDINKENYDSNQHQIFQSAEEINQQLNQLNNPSIPSSVKTVIKVISGLKIN